MIISRAEAYELGNALLDATQSFENRKGDYCICKMDTGEFFSVRCPDKDDGHDNGFTTVVIIK